MKIRIRNKKDLLCAELVMALVPVCLVGLAGLPRRIGLLTVVAIAIGYCIGPFHEEQRKDGPP